MGFVDSGCGYGSLSELPELPGTGIEVLQNLQKSRVWWHKRTKQTGGSGMNVMQISQKFRVRV